MPRLTESKPKYRHHKASGQAVVTISGKDHYLGPWRSKASRREYDRLIGEWLAAGRPSHPLGTPDEITVTELCNVYRKYAKGYYVKNGQPTGAIDGIRVVVRMLRESYGKTKAVEFGPLALKSLQAKMIELDHSRRYINDNIDRIKAAGSLTEVPMVLFGHGGILRDGTLQDWQWTGTHGSASRMC